MEDFLWNLDCKFQIEGSIWKHNDEAKIRYASSCLTSRARDWFQAYHYQVNLKEAESVGIAQGTLDERYW